MAADAVAFSKVVKTYDTFRALDKLSFSIHAGELYGLIGPNGAGKTTAIKVLTGLRRATSGKATVLGYEPQDPAVRPLVGYMPQETALYLDLSVRENLELFGRLYDMPKAALKSRVAELLDFVNLRLGRQSHHRSLRRHAAPRLSGCRPFAQAQAARARRAHRGRRP
jgi:ABC-2 type transport system ATP-binding protein